MKEDKHSSKSSKNESPQPNSHSLARSHLTWNPPKTKHPRGKWLVQCGVFYKASLYKPKAQQFLRAISLAWYKDLLFTFSKTKTDHKPIS